MTIVLYTLARMLLLVASAAVLYVTGARGLLLWVMAFVLSGLLSLVFLRGLRARMSETIAKSRGSQALGDDQADSDQDRTE